MYRRCCLILAAVLVSSVTPAAASRFETEMKIGVHTAIQSDGELQKSEVVLEPRLDVTLPDGARLTGKARIRTDFADNLEPGKPSNDSRSWASGRWFVGNHTDLELRELFVDMDVGQAQLRLGKQQVVWGQADGLRILDVVNPLSFREFILPDFEDRRIPLWMVNAELPIGPAMLQLLWIPDLTYDEFPEEPGTFAFTSPRFRPPLADIPGVRVNDPQKPNRAIRDSDAGVRVGAFAGGWDLTVNYLFHYQDQPVFLREVSADAVQLTAIYERTHLLGLTGSNAFGDFVLRTEFGYSTDRYFAAPDQPNGVTHGRELSGVIGLDYGGVTDTIISGQFFQSTIEGTEGMLRPRHERTLSLLVRRALANDTIELELLALHNTNDGDGLVQFDASYLLSSSITLGVGIDVFYGTELGLFGQFDGRDRVTFRLDIGI